MLWGGDWRPDYSPQLIRRELDIIRTDLHCNAVRSCGRDPSRVLGAAEYALGQGLARRATGPPRQTGTLRANLNHSPQLAGPVDSYLLHGSFYFSSGRNSVRMRHLAARPAVSATHLVGEELAVTVHGRAELFELADPARGELRQAMLDYYLPLQGPAFETWLDEADPVATRIEAEKMFIYSTND